MCHHLNTTGSKLEMTWNDALKSTVMELENDDKMSTYISMTDKEGFAIEGKDDKRSQE